VARASGGLLLGAGASALAIALFLWLADEVMRFQTQAFDTGVAHYFHVHRTPAAFQFMAGVTWMASGTSMAILAIGAALYFGFRHRTWAEGAAVLTAAFGGMLLDEGLKRIFHRERPEQVFYHLGYSFPSGHSLSVVAIYGMLAYLISRELPSRRRAGVWAIAILLMLLVGFSRIYLRQHYVTDVAGGYLAGACWLLGCIYWLSVLRRRTAGRDDQPESSQG
jgi:undecaprenyl-diphosphatase